MIGMAAGRSPMARRVAGRLERERGIAIAGSVSAGAIAWVAPGDTSVDVTAALAARPRAWWVTGWIGTHRDARAPGLRAQWDLEEACRATGLPTLALRMGPLLDPNGPLWNALRAGPPRGPVLRKLVHPLVEDDLVELLARAASDPRDESEWWEVAGFEVMTVADLAALARGAAGLAGSPGEWEPALEELREQRLVEPEQWTARFGIAATPVTEWARRSAA